MASAIFNALKYIPASVGIKALEKYNPKFKNYFAKVAAYGLDTNRALDYLSDRFGGSTGQNYKEELAQGEKQGTLRPDELASKSNLENREIPGKLLRSALSLGGGLIGAGASLGSGLLNPEAQEEATTIKKSKPKKKPLMQQEEERFEQAKEESYFSKAYKALEKGRNVVEGKSDHILSEARPFFDRGDINSPDELKQFYNSYYRTRGNAPERQQPNQGIDPKLMSAMNAISQSMERLRNRQGG